jgi:hypothetical protein
VRIHDRALLVPPARTTAASAPASSDVGSAASAFPAPTDERVLCDRCRAEMFRMHAVWRCPACGYKTDCCGW